jgi:hypothetical protein
MKGLWPVPTTSLRTIPGLTWQQPCGSGVISSLISLCPMSVAGLEADRPLLGPAAGAGNVRKWAGSRLYWGG